MCCELLTATKHQNFKKYLTVGKKKKNTHPGTVVEC